jgi:PAS domain S-box-containing protein
VYLKSTLSPPLLESVFRALPGLYLVLTPDLIIVEATDLFLKQTRISRAQAIGQHLFVSLPNNPNNPHKDSEQLVFQSLYHALERKEPYTIKTLPYDIRVPVEQGGGFEERYWHATSAPILDDQGQVAYLVLEVRDITEKVLSDIGRKQSQEHLSPLASAMRAVAWEYDIANNRMTWGDGLQEIFGYTPEDMGPGGESWDSRVHPDDFESVQQSIHQALLRRQPTWTGEYRFQKADGTYAHILDQGYTTYDSQGQPERTIGSIIDITKGHHTEEALKESDARFRHLLEVLPHMAWTASAQGKVLFFNDHWYSYTGMQTGQTEGWIGVIHPEDSAMVLTGWPDAVASGSSYELEYRIRNHYDGTYRWFLERAVPMHDANGNVSLWIGTYTDIEEQKQHQYSKEKKEQQLETMLRLSPVHLCVFHGPGHTCQYITPGVYKIYGSRQYIGRTAREIWPELEPIGFFDLLEEVYRTGNTVRINEYKAAIDHQLDGTPREAYFNFKYQPLFDNTNQVEGIMVSAIEVTNLVKARQEAEALAKGIS